MDKQAFKDVLNDLGGAWPKHVLTEDEVRIWFEQTSHLEASVAKKAASMCIAECEWYPTIAKYLECAKSIMRAQEASLASAPVLMTDAARKIQQQALAAQRLIGERRSMLSKGLDKGHRHAAGWTACPICVQALTEMDSADECSTCMLIEDAGLSCSHS